MKTRKVELTPGGRNFAEVNVQRGIFQGDALSPLLFIIAMMPLNHILRKCSAGFKLSKSQEKINHLMYMDNIKLFAKNEKELETQIPAVRILSGHRDRKCTMQVMKSGKRHLTDGMELLNQDKIRTFVEKETYKYLCILEADTIKQELLETKLSSRNFIKGINTWAVLLVRYSGPVLKWTREEQEN